MKEKGRNPLGVFMLQIRTVRGGSLVVFLLLIVTLAWLNMVGNIHSHHHGRVATFNTYLLMWLIMIAAMMLPSVIPKVLSFAHDAKQPHTSWIAPWFFVLGYFVAWSFYGLLSYIGYLLIEETQAISTVWVQYGSLITGITLIVVGLYQITPFKNNFLKNCRHATQDKYFEKKEGISPLRVGIEHGLQCMGSCGGLMLTMFAIGMMNLGWMGILAVLTLLEKVLPQGEKLATWGGIVFMVLGLWIVFTPYSVPFLI